MWCMLVVSAKFSEEAYAQSFTEEKYSKVIWNYLITLSGFGPRYVGTNGYEKTLKLIRQVGKEFADNVLEHPFVIKRHNGEQIRMINIEFVFNGTAGGRPILLGLTNLAIKEYEKAITLNPSFPEGNSNLGGYYFRMGKYEQAVKLFEQAIKAYPNFIQAHSNLGAVLNKLNRTKEAVPHLKKAIHLDPEFGIAYFNLGNAYINQSKLDEARKAYGLAVEKGIDFLSLHWNLHKIHIRQGKNSEAKKELKIILQIDPENLDAQKKLKELLH